MNFYFVELLNNSQLILDTKSKPRYICFKDSKSTGRYVSYLKKFKRKFGYLPQLNLSEPFTKIEPVKNSSNEKLNLRVINRDFEYLDRLSKLYGISYFYCHNFEYEDLMSATLTGQNMDGIPNKKSYAKHLEFCLKEM